MSVNSGLKATKIIVQRKAFYRQRIPEFSCVRKETVDIDILVTSRNGDRKIMLSIRITSTPPSRKRKVEPVEPVLKNIYQSNTYRKYLSWPHFDDEPRVQEKQQVKDQQSCISVFVSCLTNPGYTSPGMTTVFHTWAYGRFIDVQSNLRRKKLHRTN